MKLYIVATPIGNLEDITFRALKILENVDVICAEDTRVTKKLLTHFNIQKKLLSIHEHSKRQAFVYVKELLEEGNDIAYVVDAGTPGISDPGGYLVKYISETIPHVDIIPVPGPSALTAALSVAGITRHEFLFLGFPPTKKGRTKFFKEVLDTPYPVVLYESPHRILKTLDDLVSHGLSMFDGVLIKEISKVYETILRMKVGEMKSALLENKSNKGEFVLVINK